MKTLNLILLVLIIIGALNWGLVGAFHFDAVAHFLGSRTLASRIVYDAIGLSALVYLLLGLRKS